MGGPRLRSMLRFHCRFGEKVPGTDLLLKPVVSRKDISAVLILTLVLAAFFSPLLAQWAGFFFDDIACLYYPQQSYLSALLDRGEFPLWDPVVCSGGTPFFSRLFSSAYYPVNWLFLAIGGGSYFWLVLFPLFFHYLLAGVFAYLLGRVGLGLNVPGSALMALAYSLSPSLIYMSTFPPEVFVQAWLPLLALCTIAFARTGRLSWLLLGSGAFALTSTSGDVPFVFHCVFLWGCVSGAWCLFGLVSRSFRRAGRAVAGTVTMMVLGGVLAGLYWANVAQGVRMLALDSSGVVENLCSVRQSLHPLYLLSLLLPDFFGGVDSVHAWGAAFASHCSLNDGNLLGGLSILFLVVVSLPLIWRDRVGVKQCFPPRWQGMFFGFLTLLGLIVVLGPHTPLYSILKGLNPYLGMPYPLRYRIIQGFGMSGLIGVCASSLWKLPRGPRPRLVALGLGIVAVLSLLALVWSYPVGEKDFVSGITHLRTLNSLGWFFRAVGGYALAVGFLLLVISIWRRSRFGRLLVFLVAGEILFFSAQAFYRNRVLNRRLQDISAERFSGPSDHPFYRLVDLFHEKLPEVSPLWRRGYFRSSLDNLGWVFPSNSVLGVDVKPMVSRYADVVSVAAPGYPYELHPEDWKARFWPNMSVRYLISEREVHDPELVLRHRLGRFFLYEHIGAIPRVYFQDRWAAAEPERARQALLEYDLRHVGYLPREVWDLRPLGETYPEQEEMSLEEGVERFRRLQEDNPLKILEFPSPNRVELEIVNETPGMLVLTDIWHPDWRATVNGCGEKIHRVNYLQRGLWLRPGRNRVVLEFLPVSLGPGLAATALGLVGLCCLLILIRRQERRGRAG